MLKSQNPLSQIKFLVLQKKFKFVVRRYWSPESIIKYKGSLKLYQKKYYDWNKKLKWKSRATLSLNFDRIALAQIRIVRKASLRAKTKQINILTLCIICDVLIERMAELCA